jgi:hypothetical protein
LCSTLSQTDSTLISIQDESVTPNVDIAESAKNSSETSHQGEAAITMSPSNLGEKSVTPSEAQIATPLETEELHNNGSSTSVMETEGVEVPDELQTVINTSQHSLVMGTLMYKNNNSYNPVTKLGG